MNVQESTHAPSKLFWYQYSIRLLTAVTLFSTVLSYYIWFRPEVLAREIYYRNFETIASLAKKRPSTLTPEQWEAAMEWTYNLTANSNLESEASLTDLRRFQRDLEEKAKGEVDMATIFWIWDQHAQLTPTGKKYQRFRQDMLDMMRWVESPPPKGTSGSGIPDNVKEP